MYEYFGVLGCVYIVHGTRLCRQKGIDFVLESLTHLGI